MRMSRDLLTNLAKFKQIDTALFEEEAEWGLLDACLAMGISDEGIGELEQVLRDSTESV